MSEEAKDKGKIQENNQSEKEDNRLPYETPKLRKHGKVSNVTQLTPFPGPSADFSFLFFSADIS